MVELENGLELPDLQSLAEFPLEYCFDADGIAGFDEDRDGLDRQQRSNARDFLREGDFIFCGHFYEVGEKVRRLYGLLNDPAA